MNNTLVAILSAMISATFAALGTWLFIEASTKEDNQKCNGARIALQASCDSTKEQLNSDLRTSGEKLRACLAESSQPSTQPAQQESQPRSTTTAGLKNGPTANLRNQTGDRDFRKATWGSSKGDVRSLETEKPNDDSESMLVYDGTVANFSAYIVYVFVQDKLVRGKYIVTEPHANKTTYISDFEVLKELLKTKYGEPAEDETQWLNDLYRTDPQEWGMAISAGHLVYRTVWTTAKSRIGVYLHGDNYEVSLVIEYASIELKDLEATERKKLSLDGL